MKICYIADANSIHTQRWVKYFADKGHEVHLISFEPFNDSSINVGNITLYTLKEILPKIKVISLFINFAFFTIQIRRMVKKINPDVLHAHYITDCGVFGCLSGFHPLVLSAWGSDIYVDPQESMINNKLIRHALGKADMVFTDSNDLRERTIALGSSSERVKIAQWGVNLKQFNPDMDGEEVRSHLSLGECQTIIISTRFVSLHNIDCLIGSIPIVLRDLPYTKFIIKGFGPLEEDLKNMAKEKDVWDAIRFVGRTKYEEIAQYLNASDIYVSTSLSDSTPVALLEAMACGLPVIVTDLPSHKEWITDGWNGYLVSKGDPEELAEKIISMLKKDEQRRLFGERNFSIIEEKANYFDCMEKVELQYNNLLQMKK